MVGKRGIGNGKESKLVMQECLPIRRGNVKEQQQQQHLGDRRQQGKDPDGARMEYQPDHPAGRARCVVCAAILLGIEFQIEIQQTRNYCQASPQEISRQHIMYRLFNFSCPRTAAAI